MPLIDDEIDETQPITCPLCKTAFPDHPAFRVMTDHTETCWLRTLGEGDWDDTGCSTGLPRQYWAEAGLLDEEEDDAQV